MTTPRPSFKLETFKGNLDKLVKIKPSRCLFYVMTESKFKLYLGDEGAMGAGQ